MLMNFHSLLCVMMSQQSGDQFAALIRVNTYIYIYVSEVALDLNIFHHFDGQVRKKNPS